MSKTTEAKVCVTDLNLDQLEVHTFPRRPIETSPHLEEVNTYRTSAARHGRKQIRTHRITTAPSFPESRSKKDIAGA